MGEGFGCVQCHGVGDTPPVQVFERQGVNFDVAAERLRKEYYMRWLLDPLRIDPDDPITLSERAKLYSALGRHEEAFADLMNLYAERLGMTATSFRNSTGLPDPDHYTTARDIAILAKGNRTY